MEGFGSLGVQGVRVFCESELCSRILSFRKLGVPYFGVLIIRILVFRVLSLGPLFSETPASLTPQRGLGFTIQDVKSGHSQPTVSQNLEEFALMKNPHHKVPCPHNARNFTREVL